MTKKQNYKKLLYALLTLFLLVITLIGGRGIIPAFADSSGYTSALSDLQKDGNFDINKYPDKANDYSIQIIRVAENSDKELFVYTYQPCQKTTYLVATQVSMSLTDKLGVEVKPDIELTDEDKPKLYSLTLINTDGVFCKYKVNKFTVSKEAVRYYNIVSVYRKFNKDYGDTETGNGNVINSVYFKVGKLFKAETVDGSVKYFCKNVDTIEIINPFVDFISYGQQSNWDYIFGVTKWTDIHYIAFSTDKKIDTLKEADVKYTTQSYHYTGKNNEGYTYGEKSDPQYITLTGKEEIGIDGYEKYTWNSIYRTEDFIKTTELTGAAKTEVEKSEFVLVFLKTSFDEQELWSMMQGHYKEADGVKVSDVAILRLMFETDGITYNLGTLMNEQEGDDIAGNKPENEFIGFWAYIWRCIVRLFNGTATLSEQIVSVIVLFIVVLALPILLTVLSFVFPAFGAVMKTLLKGIWYVISSPFRFFAWIVRKIKGDD